MNRIASLSLQIITHIATDALVQAILWAMIIWHYDLQQKDYVIYCISVFVLITMDFLICLIFKKAPLQFGHLADLIFVMPSLITVIIRTFQRGITLVAAIVCLFTVIAVFERFLLLSLCSNT